MQDRDARDANYKSAGQAAAEAGIALKGSATNTVNGFGAKAALDLHRGMVNNKEAHQKLVEALATPQSFPNR